MSNGTVDKSPRLVRTVEGVVALMAGIIGLLITLGGPLLSAHTAIQEQKWKIGRLEQSQITVEQKVNGQQDKLTDVRERMIRIEGKIDALVERVKK